MSDTKLSRRHFIKGAAVATAGAAVVKSPYVMAKPKTIRWKMVTTWPKNFPGLGTGANSLAKKIYDMSDRRLKIKVFGAGEIVPAMGVFDAVSRGTVQMGHAASYYWQGKHSATNFFAAVPFGFNAQEMNAWLEFGGGQKLWDEVYAPFKVKAFAAGNTGVQMGGWFNRPINSMKDFKGLRIRMPGLGGKVLNKHGAAVVTLSGGEIFQALKMGTIDATEWVGPYNDLAFGLHKAAKFYYWPGWHEPGTTLECVMNKKAYESLPKDLQAVVKIACQSMNDEMFAEYTLRNAEALKTLIDKHKVKLKKFPDSVLKALEKTSQEILDEVAKQDSLTKKVLDSYRKHRSGFIEWNKVSELGYSQARA